MYLSENELALSDEFVNNGYVIRRAPNKAMLEKLRSEVCRVVSCNAEIKGGFEEQLLNNFHLDCKSEKLNAKRLEIINFINSNSDFHKMYFEIAKPYLETIVGNELVMQRRINLSIQAPGDESSLLGVHADTWNGDSAYEVVVWIPLVNCHKTKSMYILPPGNDALLESALNPMMSTNSEAVYEILSPKLKFLDVKFGEILIFNQGLPHGNVINQESETRWSMNCRFKSVFSPYGDKKIGEFFIPITLRAATRNGMRYKFPKL